MLDTILINELISTLLILAAFMGIPFLFWLTIKKKGDSFYEWIGIYRPVIAKKKSLIIVTSLIVIILALRVIFLNTNIFGTYLGDSIFKGMGISGVIPVIVYSFIKTGFCDELLYRGFIGKLCISKLGFGIGNVVQALIFAIVTSAGLIGSHNVLAFIVFVITAAIGWLLGYLTEKVSDGSIVPAWLVHGGCNLILTLPATLL